MTETDVETVTVRRAIEAELRGKTTKKVRNVFFLCRSADDFKSVYAIAGNNNQIFAVAFVSYTNGVEIVI